MAALAGCFKNVEGAEQVYFEIEPWVGDAGGYCDLRCKVVNLSGKPHRTLDFGSVANVTHRDLQPAGVSRRLLQSFEVVPNTPARKIVKDVNLRVCALQQAVRPV